jgi:hypothetical protein
MDHDEQRVRTMAGWIGVEISRSRVRTPGKVGYGLYRVRGSRVAYVQEGGQRKVWEGVPSEWTAYAFTLEQIGCQVALSIRAGTPARPGPLNLYRADSPGVADMVPTRWTTAYRGRRDLGAGGGSPIPAQVKPDFGALAAELGALIRAGVVHVPTTPRQRQRADNAAFQAEHLEARAHGLRARYAAKMERSDGELPGSAASPLREP